MDDTFNEILEKVKATASSAYAAAGSAAKIASQKVGESIDNTKVNIKIYNLTSERRDLYTRLGELVYQTGRSPSTDTVQIERLITEIDAKNAEIDALSAKPSGGSQTGKVCPNCGAECAPEATFCAVCGKQF